MPAFGAAKTALLMKTRPAMLETSRTTPGETHSDARTPRARASKATDDIRESFERWQLWWLLGLNDIRQRYRRSRLGQTWITLSLVATIVAIGVTYSTLFRMDIKEYLPFLTVNLVVWALIAGLLNDSCMAFISADGYMRQERLPKAVFILRVIVRNCLIFGHNAILIPVAMLVLGVSISWTILLAIPGFAWLLLNGALAGLFLGVMCARFRDLPQIVSNIVQIAFFVSPIMWKRSQLLEQHQSLVDFNPFAAHLVIISEPILGRVPTLGNYLMCLASTLLLAAVALPFYARYRERIVYWL